MTPVQATKRVYGDCTGSQEGLRRLYRQTRRVYGDYIGVYSDCWWIYGVCIGDQAGLHVCKSTRWVYGDCRNNQVGSMASV